MRNVLMMVFVFVLGSCAKAPPSSSGPAPVLKSVYFDTGSAVIKDSQKPVIAAASKMLKTSDWWVVCLGLTDATGDWKTNQALAQRRAEAVAGELRKMSPGIQPPVRIKAAAIGEQLATGGSTVLERKVEFVFYKNTGQSIDKIINDSRVLSDDFQRKSSSK